MKVLDLLSGRLTLAPGATASIRCVRPMVAAGMMRRLTEGRRAALLPDLVGTVFTQCACAQRSTSRRAVRAAFGATDDAEATARDALALRLFTAREHLQRLAVDLPALVPAPDAGTDLAWLRDAPLLGLPPQAVPHDLTLLRGVDRALPGWLGRRVFGQPAAAWWARWQAQGGVWLAEWAAAGASPVARWLARAHDAAQAIAWPCRALDLLNDPAPGLATLATDLARDGDFAEHPVWQGDPAETGPWTRHGRTAPPAVSAWDRLGARLADLAGLAAGQPLAFGAMTLGPREGIAWTEMSRGLLIHWIRLDRDADAAAAARADAYRVVSPTAWNFHPAGGLATRLREAPPSAAAVRLAAMSLDPCLQLEVLPPAEPGDA